MMKRLLCFEIKKTLLNPLSLAIAMITIVFLVISMLFYIFTDENYMQIQVINAKGVIFQITENDHNNSEVETYYNKIQDAKTWQEMHQIYNELDQYYLTSHQKIYTTDLSYDYHTNIAMRNYNVENNIDPDEESPGDWLYKTINTYGMYYIVIVCIFITVTTMYAEKENQTINYYYTLPYRYEKLYFSKFMVTIINVTFTCIIPIIIAYTIMCIITNSTNPAGYVPSIQMFSTLQFHTNYFIHLSKYVIILPIAILCMQILSSIILLFVTSIINKFKVRIVL